MFLVGLELDPRAIRRRSRSALIISQASIVFPFLLGAVLSVYLHPRLAERGVSLTHFALFVFRPLPHFLPFFCFFLVIKILFRASAKIIGARHRERFGKKFCASDHEQYGRGK